MNRNGARDPDPRYVAARRVLLDALEALGDHRQALVLVGAQAVYLYAGELDEIAVAVFTEDADLVLDPAILDPHPPLLDMLRAAGFVRRLDQQGIWEKQGTNTTVDFLVPEVVAGPGSRKADLGPHGREVARRARGLEATLVDQERRTISALEAGDNRAFEVAVAGPAALIVAKVHKIHDRLEEARAGKRTRQKPKDALDYLRLLQASETDDLVLRLTLLRHDDRSRQVTEESMTLADALFASPEADGSRLLAQAVAAVADADVIVASAVALTADLSEAYQASLL